MNYFKNLKIKTKIYSLAGSLIILFLVITELGNWRNEANEMIIYADKVDHNMLEARRSEKDFFMRREIKYTVMVRKAYENIINITAQFKNNNHYAEITENVKNYYYNFRKTVNIEKELGLEKNIGLRGNLRKSVHSIEAIVKAAHRDNIMVQLLTARRHEKDFMLRGDKKYIDELHKAVNQMTLIANVSNLPATSKTKINKLVKSYLKSFDDYAKKIDEKNAAIVNLRTAVHKVEPLIAQLITIAKNNSSFWRSIASTLTIISILIGIFLSLFITKLITEPVKRLTESAESFGKGEENIRIETDSNDEIGTLARTMNNMIEQIGLQIYYLDNLPAPVIIIDKDYNVRYINKYGCEITGKSKGECLAGKCYDLMCADHCNTDKCSLKKAMKDRRVHRAEQIARPNGKKIDIFYSGAPVINKNGELLGAMEYVLDISSVKESEKYLNRSVNTIMAAMEKFAQGDLTVKVEAEKSGDNITKLFTALNNTVEKIRQTIIRVIQAVESTARASTEISSSAEQMAAGAQEQSAQTGEVSASVQQMAATILESTKNSTLAAELATKAGDNAKIGGEVVKQTINGIENVAEVVSNAAGIVEELGENSNKIGEIIEVIDDIADQTNLLALNAAIEAARAGEQGRGFAVVADEVRKLAERTTNATKEIAGMIKQIQSRTAGAVESMRSGKEETDKGKKLALEAGKSLKEILIGSNHVIEAIEQVAATSEEQSATVEQVSKNVEGINIVAQESAAGVEQIARASEDLNRLTENLQQLVNLFNLDNDDDFRYTVNDNGTIIPKEVF